jgi:hypothetical protein
METQIRAANGGVFAVYTQGGQNANIASVYSSYIAPYFDGSWHTGTRPPINYPFTPYTDVISLVDGTVLAMDTSSTYLSGTDIMNAVNQANNQ